MLRIRREDSHSFSSRIKPNRFCCRSKSLTWPVKSTMKTGSWTFLCVSILSLTPWTTGRQLCPNEVDLRPCTCFSNSDGEATVDCSDVATSGEIWSVFNKAPWPSSRLQLFFLSLNTKLKDLPDGAFGNISFASMYLTLTNLETIAPSALLPSRDRLAHLAIVHSSLEEFPFELLPRMPRLQILHLSHNLLTSVPPLQSQSLQELNLLNNHILKVEETGWATPNLKVLDIGKNPLSRFPSGILNGLEKLEEFSCSECNLGSTLSRGLLDFRSRALRVVHLDGNNISRLEPGAITGLQPNTSVYLRGMENLALSEDSFRPMLEVLTQGDGVLILGRKLFGCDCDVAWLVADRTFLRSIDGGCSSGTELKDLESDSMKNCPRPCPYWCVSRKFMSLCTPGTAILSKVDDCRSNEVETESRERASGPSPPSNPDPKTERTPCSPTIGFCLSSRHSYCRAENEWELTDLFWCSGDRLCCASKTAVEKRKMELLSNKKCGQRVEPARQGRSAGGSSSYIGEWPWQAAIYDVSREEIICGAALIRENWLLTTASCLNVKGSRISRRPNEFIVYLGKYYRNHSLDDGFVQRRQMSRIILHEDLNLRNLDSDIALVRLTEPAILTWRVQLACLPNQFHPSEENPNDGKFGWVAGWGVDDSDTPSHALADVNIPVISNSKCIQDTIYTTGDLASTGILTSNMFCAGYGIETPLEDYKTVCPGDSGSPMVFYSESSWQVEGIVSHSFSRERCSARRPGQYAVFTKVNRFISWIESKIENTP
ncbi:unnamed protein product [Darwinula stevensoni]|uniref:Peptidase S1 domain-containing protein n=1 Tax=Darwinula stevensoni TaxID=69355 RepID=A0A7R9AD13_9CRUS|nr:unnamed protein product [Darwinula stevensoni]CAG0900556.1 unnamed protein product [Darwinula stevensoni]